MIDGYLIGRKPSSEKFELWILFSKERGLVSCLHRIPSNAQKRGTADLWDRLDVELQRSNKSGPNGPSFVKDFQIRVHHTSLGKDWLRLERASRLAKLLEHNLAEQEPREDLFALVEQALQAWENEAPIDAVFIKFLLRWIHMEGYGHPEFWRQASDPSRDLWKQLGRKPVADFANQDFPWKQALEELETFLRTETEFHLPAMP